jgi:hypothetical protein
MKVKAINFSKQEKEVRSLRDQIEGEEKMPRVEASKHALAVLPNPDPVFVTWLSDGTLALVDGIVETLPGGRP